MTRYSITPPADFRYLPTLRSHGWLDLLPFSYNPTTHALRRVQRLSDDTITAFTITAADTSDNALHITTDEDITTAQQAEITALVARCFNFERDLTALYAYLRQHPDYTWAEKVGFGRILIAPTVWENIAKTLLTTNTTWRQTRQMVSRLVTLGDHYTDDEYTFPTPEQVAALTADALNEHVRAGYRSAYLHELARNVATRTFDPESLQNPDLPAIEVYKQLRALKGFGEYAAGATLHLLGHHSYLALDSEARTAYRQRYNNGEKAPDSAIRDHYARYGDWQGLFMWMDVMQDHVPPPSA